MNFNLHDLLTNQFLVGLSGATVLGGVLYVCRQFPHQLWQLFLNQCSVGLDVKNSDTAFYWIEQWLAQHPYFGRARRLRLAAGRPPGRGGPGGRGGQREPIENPQKKPSAGPG